MKELELIVYDFDGVMTDNKVYVDHNGNETVRVNRADGLAVSEIKKLGIAQIIISTEKPPVVTARANKLNINCVQGIDNKKENLHKFVKNRTIKFITQNLNQEKLVKSHFGKNVKVKTLGIWTSDLPEKLDYQLLRKNKSTPDFILFHGAPISAKGVYYSLDIAKNCPEIEFIFPFDKLNIGEYTISSNCTYDEMNWYNGLKEYSSNARIVLVPSLNFTPIESALVKSLIYFSAVAVVDIESSFSAEIDDRAIIKLYKDPKVASKDLIKYYESNWVPNKILLNDWIQKHYEKNINSLSRYLAYS